jgi:hypothetical protein
VWQELEVLLELYSARLGRRVLRSRMYLQGMRELERVLELDSNLYLQGILL